MFRNHFAICGNKLQKIGKEEEEDDEEKEESQCTTSSVQRLRKIIGHIGITLFQPAQLKIDTNYG